jgi:hypothetical protein
VIIRPNFLKQSYRSPVALQFLLIEFSLIWTRLGVREGEIVVLVSLKSALINLNRLTGCMPCAPRGSRTLAPAPRCLAKGRGVLGARSLPLSLAFSHSRSRTARSGQEYHATTVKLSSANSQPTAPLPDCLHPQLLLDVLSP